MPSMDASKQMSVNNFAVYINQSMEHHAPHVFSVPSTCVATGSLAGPGLSIYQYIRWVRPLELKPVL